MQRSTERFLTTHTGSLPRPDDLIRTMFAKEEGVPVDRPALAERVRAAVAEVVARQVEAGVDVVNDGEMSKPSYATYVKDRLDGFGGTSQPLHVPGPRRLPGAARQGLRRSRPLAAQDARVHRRHRRGATTRRRRSTSRNLLDGAGRPGGHGRS